MWNEWQINGFRSDWNDWCVQGGFTQDPSVPAAPLMEGFVLAKQEGVIRGQYMEAVAGSGSLLQSAERGIGSQPMGCSKIMTTIQWLLKLLDAAEVLLP